MPQTALRELIQKIKDIRNDIAKAEQVLASAGGEDVGGHQRKLADLYERLAGYCYDLAESKEIGAKEKLAAYKTSLRYYKEVVACYRKCGPQQVELKHEFNVLRAFEQVSLTESNDLESRLKLQDIRSYLQEQPHLRSFTHYPSTMNGLEVLELLSYHLLVAAEQRAAVAVKICEQFYWLSAADKRKDRSKQILEKAQAVLFSNPSFTQDKSVFSKQNKWPVFKGGQKNQGQTKRLKSSSQSSGMLPQQLPHFSHHLGSSPSPNHVPALPVASTPSLGGCLSSSSSYHFPHQTNAYSDSSLNCGIQKARGYIFNPDSGVASTPVLKRKGTHSVSSAPLFVPQQRQKRISSSAPFSSSFSCSSLSSSSSFFQSGTPLSSSLDSSFMFPWQGGNHSSALLATQDSMSSLLSPSSSSFSSSFSCSSLSSSSLFFQSRAPLPSSMDSSFMFPSQGKNYSSTLLAPQDSMSSLLSSSSSSSLSSSSLFFQSRTPLPSSMDSSFMFPSQGSNHSSALLATQDSMPSLLSSSPSSSPSPSPSPSSSSFSCSSLFFQSPSAGALSSENSSSMFSQWPENNNVPDLSPIPLWPLTVQTDVFEPDLDLSTVGDRPRRKRGQ